MTVKLLTEHHLEILSLRRDCIGSSESCSLYSVKSHVVAQIAVLINHSPWFTFTENEQTSLRLGTANNAFTRNNQSINCDIHEYTQHLILLEFVLSAMTWLNVLISVV